MPRPNRVEPEAAPKRRGRPPIPADERRVRLVAWVDPDTARRITTQAKQRHESLGTFLDTMVRLVGA
jgi:hypothetical protein